MRIFISVSGFRGQSVTLAALHDSDTGMLVIAKQVAFRLTKPEANDALVCNASTNEADFIFTDDHIAEAIRDYYLMKGHGHISLADALARYEPDNKIEVDDINESGRKFRISNDIDNGQMAVLAAVAFIKQQEAIGDCMSAIADLSIYSI